jgi:hypothetical protein
MIGGLRLVRLFGVAPPVAACEPGQEGFGLPGQGEKVAAFGQRCFSGGRMAT